eukprot:gene19149-25759_t
MASGAYIHESLRKEIEGIDPLKYRNGVWRLDLGPFLAGYVVALCCAINYAVYYNWHMFTVCSYGLGICALLQILTFLFTHWSIDFKARAITKRVDISDADTVLVVPVKFSGSKEMVPLERRSLREGLNTVHELGFEFRKQRFVFNDETAVFERLKFPSDEPFEFYQKASGMGSEQKAIASFDRRLKFPSDKPFEFYHKASGMGSEQKAIASFDRRLKFPSNEPIEFYHKASGMGSEQKAIASFDRYGMNRVDVPVPAFGLLLKDHLLAPFFCFQVFCVFLWMLDDYWYYSLFTLFMLITFECTIVAQRQRNLKELRTLQTPKQSVNVYSTEAAQPQGAAEILDTQAECKRLQGVDVCMSYSTIVGQRQRNLKELRTLQTPKLSVNVYRGGKWEMLPGEALLPGDIISIGRPSDGPQSEEKVVPADCLLLSGSCIVEEAVLTGESTPQWKISIVDMEANEKLDSKLHKNHILFSGTKILQHTPSKEGKIRPPGFETSQGRLMRTILFSTERVSANSMEAGVFILFLMVFAIAAAYYVLKNGLADPTRDRFKLILNCVMIVTSVIPPELPMELSMAVNASLLALTRKRVFCTEPFRIPFAGKVEDVVGDTENHDVVMATCHSLIKIGDDVVGDPLEKAAILSVDWSYSEDKATNFDKSKKATILHRHHFNSNLKRMSCVVRVEELKDGKKGEELWAVLKGAPEMVKEFLGTVPSNYDSLHKEYASQGARIISLSHNSQYLMHHPTCPLKDDSEPALRELKESSHQLMMITGDAPLTACFAASKVHIVTRDVMVLSHKTEEKGQSHGIDKIEAKVEHDNAYHWVSPDETEKEPFSRDFIDLVDIASRYDLAITGDALAYVDSIKLSPKVIPLCQLFARVSPEQKELVLVTLRSLGMTTLMVFARVSPEQEELVFARVSPEQKELVLVTLRSLGMTTLMVGDGTNDVGGLKAAHVGVALLTETDTAEKYGLEAGNVGVALLTETDTAEKYGLEAGNVGVAQVAETVAAEKYGLEAGNVGVAQLAETVAAEKYGLKAAHFGVALLSETDTVKIAGKRKLKNDAKKARKRKLKNDAKKAINDLARKRKLKNDAKKAINDLARKRKLKNDAKKARKRKLKNDAKKAINDLAEGKTPSLAIVAAVAASEAKDKKSSKDKKGAKVKDSTVLCLPPVPDAPGGGGELVVPPIPEAPGGGPLIPAAPSAPPAPFGAVRPPFGAPPRVGPGGVATPNAPPAPFGAACPPFGTPPRVGPGGVAPPKQPSDELRRRLRATGINFKPKQN